MSTVTTEERCVHEIPRAWCADCRPGAALRRVPTWGRGRAAGPVEVRHRFIARYSGRCGQCDEEFQAGDEIGVSTDADYLCEDCCR